MYSIQYPMVEGHTLPLAIGVLCRVAIYVYVVVIGWLSNIRTITHNSATSLSQLIATTTFWPSCAWASSDA